MKVEIDTKIDSKEEIKQAIKLLMSSLGEDKEIFSNEPDLNSSIMPKSSSNIIDSKDDAINDSDESNSGYINLFASNDEIKSQENESQNSSSGFAGFFSNSTASSNTEKNNSINHNEDNDNEDEEDEDLDKEEEKENDEFFKEYDDEDTKKKPRITFY
ncbi:MAG: hypothetical protein ACMXX5_02165 [Candidatus Woesearchaeota archaeon]